MSDMDPNLRAPSAAPRQLAWTRRTPADLRAYIEAQMCPWCPAGPFRSLAGHTQRAHGVTAEIFRELAGLTRHAPLCAEDYSAERAEMLAGQALPTAAYGRTGGKHVFSDAGRVVQRAKSIAQSADSKRVGGRASGDKQLAANLEKHVEIVRRFNAGEGMVAIADAVGVSQPTVRRTLRREGLYVDGRTRRHQHPSWRA